MEPLWWLIIQTSQNAPRELIKHWNVTKTSEFTQIYVFATINVTKKISQASFAVKSTATGSKSVFLEKYNGVRDWGKGGGAC